MSVEPEYKLSEYELRRKEKIRRNNEKLEELGLIAAKDKLKKMKPKKTVARRKALPRIKSGDERRSPRIAKLKSSLVMLSYDEDDGIEQAIKQVGEDYYFDSEDSNGKKVDSRQFRSRKSNIQRADMQLTEDEREALERNIDENYLSKFKEFLMHIDKISDSNVRNVTKQISKLARGEGIRYESKQYGWPEGCYFKRGTKITPLSDIGQLMEEAQECENKWGKDHGNGWLLSHPLKKLFLFQQFALNNPDFLTAKCRLQEYFDLEEDQESSADAGTATTPKPDEGVGSAKAHGKGIVLRGDSLAIASPAPAACARTRKGTKPKLPKEPYAYLGRRISKDFDGVTYFGTITNYSSDSKLWHVVYDDEDKEDFDEKEMMEALLPHHNEMDRCAAGNNKKSRKRPAATDPRAPGRKFKKRSRGKKKRE